MLALVVVLGLVIGSFLNVVIARLPEHRSLWAPRSACPTCGAAIAWHDNIPLLSYVALRGHCRACAAVISWRYPAVEAATGLLFAAAYERFGPTRDFGIAVVLLAALIAITAIDLRLQIIPDAITLPGIVVGFAANLATSRVSWVDSAIGVVVGGGIFWAILEGSLLLTGREGMGGGDVKLGAMLGAFLGWKVALLSIFLAVLLGGFLALGLLASRRTGRKDPIPFGPFLAAGGGAGLFWGERLVTWYMSAFAG
jgi:leader peptidase (prepilin peptidase) / N-methyltransferase